MDTSQGNGIKRRVCNLRVVKTLSDPPEQNAVYKRLCFCTSVLDDPRFFCSDGSPVKVSSFARMGELPVRLMFFHVA